MTHDAIVVGGGHNGLVAAFYLARGGMRPLVLERRDIVGGACVTEEFAPGFRASTGAYVLSMLREAIWRDMRLVERGVVVDPAGPSLYLFPDGRRLLIGEDQDETVRAIAAFSAADAARLPGVRGRARRARPGDHADDRLDAAGPPLAPRRRPRAGCCGTAGPARGTATRPSTRCTCSPPPRGSSWTSASSPSTSRPRWAGTRSTTPCSARRRRARRTCCCTTTRPRTRAAACASGGSCAAASAASPSTWPTRRARRARRSAPARPWRRSWSTATGAARGVRLESGEELLAPIVLSNADPKHTFLDLVDADALPAPFLAALRSYRCIGTSVKINLAVNALPAATGVEAPAGDIAASYLGGIMEVGGSLAELDRAQAEALAGKLGTDPHIELCIPTVHDPSLAPPGHHVITIDINSQPYALADGRLGRVEGGRRRPRDRDARAVVPGADGLDRAPAGAEPARPRADPRPDRRARAARRHELRPAVRAAAGARLGRLPHAGLRACTCAGRARTRAAASPAPTATTPRARCCATPAAASSSACVRRSGDERGVTKIAVLDAPLQPDPLDPAQVLEGEPVTSDHALAGLGRRAVDQRRLVVLAGRVLRRRGRRDVRGHLRPRDDPGGRRRARSTSARATCACCARARGRSGPCTRSSSRATT